MEVMLFPDSVDDIAKGGRHVFQNIENLVQMPALVEGSIDDQNEEGVGDGGDDYWGLGDDVLRRDRRRES